MKSGRRIMVAHTNKRAKGAHKTPRPAPCAPQHIRHPLKGQLESVSKSTDAHAARHLAASTASPADADCAARAPGNATAFSPAHRDRLAQHAPQVRPPLWAKRHTGLPWFGLQGPPWHTQAQGHAYPVLLVRPPYSTHRFTHAHTHTGACTA